MRTVIPPLSHPNPSCWQAVAAYVIAIAHLLNHSGDRLGAFAAAATWAAANANDEVQSWLADAAQDVAVPYEPQIGFVRIGFTHAFRHLRQGTGYVAALTETLAGGGDTDTNACIVGGLIGAAVGAAAIPTALRHAVLTCDTQRGQSRPTFLHPRQALAGWYLARLIVWNCRVTASLRRAPVQ
ncbi:MAG: ADP-ribosylglycohydrolase family protein [Caldilineaceae bacterium]